MATNPSLQKGKNVIADPLNAQIYLLQTHTQPHTHTGTHINNHTHTHTHTNRYTYTHTDLLITCVNNTQGPTITHPHRYINSILIHVIG